MGSAEAEVLKSCGSGGLSSCKGEEQREQGSPGTGAKAMWKGRGAGTVWSIVDHRPTGLPRVELTFPSTASSQPPCGRVRAGLLSSKGWSSLGESAEYCCTTFFLALCFSLSSLQKEKENKFLSALWTILPHKGSCAVSRLAPGSLLLAHTLAQSCSQAWPAPTDMADFADSFPSAGQVLRVLRAGADLSSLPRDTSGMQGSKDHFSSTSFPLI